MPAGHKSLGASAAFGSETAPGDLEVFFVDLAKSSAFFDAEERRTPRLSIVDRERAKAMDSEEQRLWRAARIATRIILERAAGAGLRGVEFEIEAGGRPSLGRDGPYFNVSHSGEGALISVSRETPAGVDLERKRTLAMTADRRRRIITAAAQLGNDGPPLSADSDDEVLIAWVRLEAAAKARGTGIGVLLTEHGVIGGAREIEKSGRGHGFQVRDLDVGDDYVAAIAAERLPDAVRVLPFPTDDLKDFT